MSHTILQPCLSGAQIGAGKEATDGLGHLKAHVAARHMGLSVLLEVELAPLPWHGWKDGLTCRSHAFMSIADDELHAVQAALHQRGEEATPVRLRLAQGDTDAEDGAFAIGADAHGDEHGAIHKHTTLADLFITCVQDKVWEGSQGARAPDFELLVEFGSALTDLGGANLVAAELLDDLGNFASGHALNVHLRHGEVERLLAAHTTFQGAGIKGHAITYLGHPQLDLADSCGQCFGFEAVGMA